MNEITAFFSPFYSWLIIGIILGIAELLAPGGFVLLAFSGGSLLAAIAGIYLGFPWQLCFFAVGSLGCFFGFRKVFRYQKISPDEKFNTDAVKEQTGYVLETVTHEAGYVKVGGERWAARRKDLQDPPIEVGEAVKTIEVIGNKLVVEPHQK